MVPLASSPLSSSPSALCHRRSRRACQRSEMEIPMRPVRVPRICRSDARSQSPKWARRPRPARGRPARSRRGTEPETAGSRTRVLRDRTVRLLVCWIRTAVPRRTTAALVAASGEEGCRPAPETLLDSGSSSWTGGAVSRARTDQAGSARTALRGARGTCGSRLAAAVSQGTETHTFCHRPQCRSGACQ